MYRFRYMFYLYMLAFIKIGNGAPHFENLTVPTRRKPQFRHCLIKKRFCIFIHHTIFLTCLEDIWAFVPVG